MGQSPNTENYTLGKGIIYFNQLVGSVFQGERDLGNAPSFAFSLATEKLEHFSSRGGLRAKDKEIVSQITPSLTFTLDEINKENLSLLTLGDLEAVSQLAGLASAVSVVSIEDMRAALAHRQVGGYTINHGTVTGGPFQVGEPCTSDNASPGAGFILAVGASSVVISITSGLFEDTDTITGTTSTASAAQSGVMVWAAGAMLVQDSTDTTTYVAGTDYDCLELLKDDEIGRIITYSTGSITDAETLHLTYMYRAETYQRIKAFANTQITGMLRFVSDNPAGLQQEVRVWSVSLAPTGDTALIGDDWSTLGFTGEILKDETGHPDSPYMDMIMDATVT